MDPEETETIQPENSEPTQTNDQSQNNEIDETVIADGIRRDEIRYENMQDEFNSIADNIHDDYLKILKSNPSEIYTEDELETIATSGDIVLISEMDRKAFEKFRDDRLSSKQKELDEFDSVLTKKKSDFDVLRNSNKFSKDHPEVDMTALGEFIQGDLTRNELLDLKEKSNNKYEFLELALEKYKEKNPTEDDEDEVPPDLSGVNGGTSDESYTDDEHKEYLKSIGIGR
jgi:hypothetical protein